MEDTPFDSFGAIATRAITRLTVSGRRARGAPSNRMRSGTPLHRVRDVHGARAMQRTGCETELMSDDHERTALARSTLEDTRASAHSRKSARRRWTRIVIVNFGVARRRARSSGGPSG